MFMLLVCAGNYTYAINTAHVTEVVPRVVIQRIPHTPDCILGHINFSGKPIPVADLSMIVEGRPCCDSMHTRIVLLHVAGMDSPQFGLMAEKVTEAVDLEAADFEEPGIRSQDLPFLRGIHDDGKAVVQLLDVDKLYGFLQLGMVS